VAFLDKPLNSLHHFWKLRFSMGK